MSIYACLFIHCFPGIHGEHSESKGGVYDISNKRRLGLTEWDAVNEMKNGVLEIIKGIVILSNIAFVFFCFPYKERNVYQFCVVHANFKTSII